MLRERTTGTLERLMTLPLAQARPARRLRARLRLLAAVAGASSCRSWRSACSASRAARRLARRAARVGNALLGMALGLFVSAFAAHRVPGGAVHARLRLPQLLLCGLFVARDEMAPSSMAVARAAADLRLRRARRARPAPAARRAVRARRRGDRGRGRRRAGAGRGDPSPTDRLSDAGAKRVSSERTPRGRCTPVRASLGV